MITATLQEPQKTYTAITFAPVQGFIEKSRKLRDLYGSSFLLSYLSRAICQAAWSYYGYNPQKPKTPNPVVSPALINLTQGTPNQIILMGERAWARTEAKAAFARAWISAAEACRQEIESRLKDFSYSYPWSCSYSWSRDWHAWESSAWEFFYAEGRTIKEAREASNEIKRSRDWTGINWMGESSTLSGADAIAWWGMSERMHPKRANIGEVTRHIRQFYENLSQKLGESIIEPTEQLSIPELIKRSITLDCVARQLNVPENELPSVEIPLSFADINRKRDNPAENRWTGWFQGDGDRIGEYLQGFVARGEKGEAEALRSFSQAMMDWGKNLKFTLPKAVPSRESPKRLDPDGRIIYAGGDDFLGVLYRNENPKLTARECLHWLYQFPEIWQRHGEKITASVGFVWAAPGVPQRDVLQHCRSAEQSAKKEGRNRLALRILFNSGNHLEWVCPWQFLEPILEGYRDRAGGRNWGNFYQDIATLESRHALTPQRASLALALFDLYFPNLETPLNQHLARGNALEDRGRQWLELALPNNRRLSPEEANAAINAWITNLAKVGFHLCQV